MKLGITADLHITSKNDHPERLKAFESILLKCIELGIDQLIIAGDLFDETLQDFADFEKICAKKKYCDVQIHIIPGNHDAQLINDQIVSANVQVYDQPDWIEIEKGVNFLLVPYQKHKSMGQAVQEHLEGRENLDPWWAIVGHGDWLQGLRNMNPFEPGVYMPLSRRDLQLLNPDLVFLGHIHDHRRDGKVYYPGSPCGMDITETGYRRFLVFDSDTQEVEAVQISSDVLFFSLDLVILPMENEEEYLKEQIKQKVEAWELEEADIKKVQLRVTTKGYTRNRSRALEVINEELAQFSFYEAPNLDSLRASTDLDRNYLSQKLMEKMEEFSWPVGLDEPDNAMVVLDAMHLIYGE
jgi:DNA repair protein SbcD/Mre11